jgi:hypothetical protein
LSNNVEDSSNSGGESMYTMMKPVTGGNMPGVSYKIRKCIKPCIFQLLEVGFLFKNNFRIFQ